MNQRECASHLLVPKRCQPSDLGSGIALDPPSDRVNHEDIGEARDDRLSARTQFPRLTRHEAQVLWIQSATAPHGDLHYPC